MDSSTIDPNVAKSLSEAATKEGFDFLDTPVSGGILFLDNKNSLIIFLIKFIPRIVFIKI